MTLYRLDDLTPQVAGSAWVAPGAHVIGQVHLGEDSSVWFGAVLRGDNELISLGQGSNIQENCVLHTDPGFPLTIGAEVTIGHGAILHGCTIEEGALIGMGAIVLNGAVVRKGALVAAGAFVGQGKEIPAGAMAVGSPATVKRTMDAAAQTAMRAGALHYTKNAQRFAKGMTPLD